MKAIKVDYISFGAGVQSTALLALEKKGLIISKGSIFADTGEEPDWVYKTLHHVRFHGIKPVFVCQAPEKLSQYIYDKKFISIPCYTKTVKNQKIYTSMGQRQCTNVFKVIPVLKKIRWLEDTQGKKLPKHSIKLALGISTDEQGRAKESKTRWIKNVFPLLEFGLNRKDCEELCREVFNIVPLKSSCTFCPYKSKKDFAVLREKDPKGWKSAVAFDKKIRNLKQGRENYVYREKIPLSEIDFTKDEKQFDFFSDMCEEGGCGL